jgi:hypothetical protein
VRLLRSDLTVADLGRGNRRERLADALAAAIPAGVGKGGSTPTRRATSSCRGTWYTSADLFAMRSRD